MANTDGNFCKMYPHYNLIAVKLEINEAIEEKLARDKRHKVIGYNNVKNSPNSKVDVDHIFPPLRWSEIYV